MTEAGTLIRACITNVGDHNKHFDNDMGCLFPVSFHNELFIESAC